MGICTTITPPTTTTTKSPNTCIRPSLLKRWYPAEQTAVISQVGSTTISVTCLRPRGGGTGEREPLVRIILLFRRYYLYTHTISNPWNYVGRFSGTIYVTLVSSTCARLAGRRTPVVHFVWRVHNLREGRTYNVVRSHGGRMRKTVSTGCRVGTH